MTQLLNSFLGALAYPWEEYRCALGRISLSDAGAAGWPNIQKGRPKDRDPESLGDLVRLMRNAIAHGNVEFLPGGAGDIQALHVWNCHQGRRTWGAHIAVPQMRAFLTCFVQLAEELDARTREPRLRMA